MSFYFIADSHGHNAFYSQLTKYNKDSDNFKWFLKLADLASNLFEKLKILLKIKIVFKVIINIVDQNEKVNAFLCPNEISFTINFLQLERIVKMNNFLPKKQKNFLYLELIPLLSIFRNTLTN